MYHSTKTYTHAEGLSCAFRQWRAWDSHCRFIHGYALQVELDFVAIGGVDARNWVVDFGGLKSFKEWLKATFDHKMIVANDDPMKEHLLQLGQLGLAQPLVLHGTGCEYFAKYIHDELVTWMTQRPLLWDRVKIYRVVVREHEGNSGYYSEYI